MGEQETEVKFFVRDLKKVELRLRELKAQLIQPRVHEINFRYDLPDGSMRTNGRVLRIRQDAVATITYKGPSDLVDGVFSRQELETQIGDFETSQQLLERATEAGVREVVLVDLRQANPRELGRHVVIPRVADRATEAEHSAVGFERAVVLTAAAFSVTTTDEDRNRRVGSDIAGGAAQSGRAR